MDKDAQSKDYFLATTALEEFWRVDKPIIFLGEWCLLYERRSYWQTLDSILLTSPYNKTNSAENAYDYVNRLYEKILPGLGITLNKIHGEDHGSRYWRILLGPWLQLYLSTVYDRFIHIKHTIDRYPNFTTIILSEDSFVVPTDTLDFACYLSEDSFNLQVYTKILKKLGKDFPVRKAAVPRNPLYGKLLKNSWKRKVISNAIRAFANVSSHICKTTYLRSSYLSKQIELKLAVRNIGRILPGWGQMQPCPQFEYDGEMRNALREVDFGVDEFGQCLSGMLFSDIPQCFMEGYRSTGIDARNNYPNRISAIFSANSWYYDEVFKQWSAHSAEMGSLLCGTQHGGNYGALKIMPSEDHETAIVDQYYSWGWSQKEGSARIVAMPATKLAGRNQVGADNSKNGILWVATSAQRYVIQLPFLPAHFLEYLGWQKRFAKALPQEVMADIRFRPHYENYGWGTTERIQDCVPYIRTESWTKPFQESLENCRLYVCDHLSTTFTEALAANIPSILFWNPETNQLRPEAQPYYELLKKNGILFDTPEAAAAAVTAVYDDVASWWNAEERQQVIRKFCGLFARTSPDAVALWGTELKKVAEHSTCQQ